LSAGLDGMLEVREIELAPDAATHPLKSQLSIIGSSKARAFSGSIRLASPGDFRN
jgi:hypothetical protein